ncbi:MAG: PDZ domain-containing protein [Deltaproteobacteria bacterium]|nr:MAG: PDZ domain-containing protein [Deltaproteobacteria bacterium]
MKLRIPKLLLAAAAGLVLAFPASSETALTCPAVPQLFQQFLKKHVRFRYLSGDIKERVAETYVRRLDPSRTLLIDSEVQSIKSGFGELLSELSDGDCQALEELHATILKKQAEVQAFVTREVNREGFELDPTLRLVVDPEKRGYPSTKQERNALHADLAQFHLSNYLSAGSDLEEAKRKLIHRYELTSKRLEERDSRDHFAMLLDAFANSLDPHSSYLSAEMLEEFQISTSLSLEGIGAALSSRDGYAIVEQVIPGGAADRQGELQPGDKIVAVAQEREDPVDVVDMDLQDVVRLIRGRKGSRVQLTVLRQSEKLERLSVWIERDKIDLAEQAASLRFETVERHGKPLKLAVLDLSSFYGDRDPRARQSSNDVARLLETVRKEKADGLLLDLSHNGGGLLEHAVRIAGFFIDSGGIVSIQESGSPSQVLPDPDGRILYTGPMVVLTSRISASASEILAGAMQDYRRAVIVGDDHTFGKGTVQTVLPLPPGLGAIKVTTGLFFRPGGQSTQNSGVPSDIVFPSLFNSEDYGERAQQYALPGQSIEAFASREGGWPTASTPWKPVTPEIIATLAERSRARVTSSQEFADITRMLAEAESSDGVIQLADVLEVDEASDTVAATERPSLDAPGGPGAAVASTGSGERAEHSKARATDDEETPSVQVREALEILADYVGLTS